VRAKKAFNAGRKPTGAGGWGARPKRIAVAVCAALAFAAPVAHADASSDADALLTKGVELREKGRDEEALEVFRQALAKSPSARARAQVALAEQALGMWVLAETDLSAALASTGDPWITKNRGALEGALAVIQKRIATLEVRGAEQADVYVDGVRIGAGSGPFRVEAGKRTLEVRGAGFHSTTRTVELPPGGVARETVTLVPSPAAAGSAPPPPAGGVPPEERSRPAQEDPGSGQRLLGWAFVGTGAALVATGGVGMFVRKGIIDEYNATTCPGLGAEQPKSCDDQVSASRTWLTVSLLTLVGGGAFAVGGLVLVATAPSAEAPSKSTAASRPSLACSPTTAPAGMAIACAGRF